MDDEGKDLDVVFEGVNIALGGQHAHGLLIRAHTREEQALCAGYVRCRLHLQVISELTTWAPWKALRH